MKSTTVKTVELNEDDVKQIIAQHLGGNVQPDDVSIIAKNDVLDLPVANPYVPKFDKVVVKVEVD